MKAILVKTTPREAFKRFQMLPTLTPAMAVRPAGARSAPVWPRAEPERAAERSGHSPAGATLREFVPNRCAA